MTFKLCTTYFAFTNEWMTGAYTLDQLIARSVEYGLGPGVEVVGPQNFRNYPNVSDDEITAFHRSIDRFGLEPVSLGGGIDEARRRGQLMSPEETKESLSAQIRLASRLGTRVLRAYMPKEDVDLSFLEWAASRAESADVILGVEVHAPNHPASNIVRRLTEAFDKIDSPSLGFIPDFSSTMTDLPVGYIAWLGRLGLTEEQIARLRDIWLAGGQTMLEMFAEFADFAYGQGARPEAVEPQRMAFDQFAHHAPRSWSPIMDRAVHVHSKFYSLDADGTDTSIPHRELVAVLLDAGYAGYVASEWEGSAWTSVQETDGFEMVRRHQELYRRLVTEKAAAE